MIILSVGPGVFSEETPRLVDHVPIHLQEEGKSYGYTLPVYQVGNIRFLSGGVGVEERNAVYPPFSVKLILAQQSGAFLTQVSLLIQDQTGATVVDIPQNLVTGPWVYVNLPPGHYHIVGKGREAVEIKRNILVKPGQTQVYHLIWPDSLALQEQPQS